MADEDLLICEKHRYETEDEANDMINHIITIDWIPLRAYKCHVCFNWHLTKSRRSAF